MSDFPLFSVLKIRLQRYENFTQKKARLTVPFLYRKYWLSDEDLLHLGGTLGGHFHHIGAGCPVAGGDGDFVLAVLSVPHALAGHVEDFYAADAFGTQVNARQKRNRTFFIRIKFKG